MTHIKKQATFDHKNEISLSEDNLSSTIRDDLISSNNDELYNKAVDIVIKQQKFLLVMYKDIFRLDTIEQLELLKKWKKMEL